MEILIPGGTFLFLIGLLYSPVLILKTIKKWSPRFPFITYLFIATIATVIITVGFAWWANTSNQILLSHYGYNPDGLNETERLTNVNIENVDAVKSINTSLMGIGWPLKAAMGYILYSPYLLIIYLIIYLLKKKNTITP